MQINKIKKISMLLYVGLTTFLSSYNMVFADDAVNCEGNTIAFIMEIFDWVKIAIPIILIVTGTIDFVKAMIASDDQKMKKAQKDFITRLVIGIAIFFVPSILEFLLSLIGIDTCAIR